MSSPSEELSKRITLKLIDAKLIVADDQETLTEKLARGEVSEDDWRLTVEKAKDKEKGL